MFIISLGQIVTLDGDQVGKISKQWSGLAREMFTDADFFGINFPMDLDVRMKAVMLGACFLIVSKLMAELMGSTLIRVTRWFNCLALLHEKYFEFW